MSEKAKAEFEAALDDLVRKLASVPPPVAPTEMLPSLDEKTVVDARVYSGRHTVAANGRPSSRAAWSSWFFFASAVVMGALAAAVLFLGWQAFGSSRPGQPIVVNTSPTVGTPIVTPTTEVVPVAPVTCVPSEGGVAKPKRARGNKIAKRYGDADWDNPY